MLPLFIEIECQSPNTIRIMSSPWEMEDTCTESSAALSGKESSFFPPQQATRFWHQIQLLCSPCLSFLSLALLQHLTCHTYSLSLKDNLVAKSFGSPDGKEMTPSFVPFRQCPSFTFFMNMRGCAYKFIWGLCQMPKIGVYQPEERGRTRSEGKSGESK